MQRIIQNLSNLLAENVTLEHIRTVTILRLPFHLCTGTIYQINDPENVKLHLWLKNKITFPPTSEIYEQAMFFHERDKEGLSPSDFLTDALIINDNPELSPDEFEAIKEGRTDKIGLASLNNPGFKLLNETIGAHQMIRLGPYIPDVSALWPRMLTEREIINCILVEFVILAEPNYLINQDIILQLSNFVEKWPSQNSGRMGYLGDYSSEQLTQLEHAVYKIRKHAFYELKTKAIASMLSGDSIVAIVLGCAALEGVHGAFMRLAMRDKFIENNSIFNSFMDGLLREQGFYSLIQLTVKVLMNEKERPSDDELKLCLKGVSIRNAIMHAGIKKTGKYKIRQLEQSKINEGYSGIMAVYRAFEAAVEARENS